MARFIVFLMNKGYKPTSTKIRVAELGYCHNILGLPSPNQAFTIKKMNLGAKRTHPSQDQRLTVTVHMLHKFACVTDNLFPEAFEKHMFSNDFSCFSCISERRGVYNKRGERIACYSKGEYKKNYVQDRKLRGMTITLLHYKHSK